MEVADLKLAITEAASRFVSDDGGAEREVEWAFKLDDERLLLELTGTPVDTPQDEQELSRAIVEATVDEAQLGDGGAVLVKRLAA
jgi:hypothetical protein